MENNNQNTEELQPELTEGEILTEGESTGAAQAIEGKLEDGPETLGEGVQIGEPLQPDSTEDEIKEHSPIQQAFEEMNANFAERKHVPLIPSTRK